ncbi:unnamed protein product [Meganyctiphanes norvegica]|uniref:XK-related protein n=1 Tax=Meganyctiphanes norvegica TaxID=48144 RepID=A0AAV2SDC0_MEGNR
MWRERGAENSLSTMGCCGCCPEPIKNAMCSMRNSTVNWFHEKYSKHKPVLTITKKLFSIFLYVLDVVTDILTAFQYLSSGRLLWGLLTGLFIILPMIISSVVLIIINKIKGSRHSLPVKFVLVIAAIVLSPMLPISILVKDAFVSLKAHASRNDNTDDNSNGSSNMDGNGNSDDENDNDDVDDYDGNDPFMVSFVKICDALTESYPQAGMQMFIASQDLDNVTLLQCLTIVTSLVTLSFSMAINISITISRLSGRLYKPAITSRIIFNIFGLLAVAARFLVACIYSTIYSPLWFVPIGFELATSIFIWVTIRWGNFSMFVPLDQTHHFSNKWDVFYVILRWLRTAAYNSFTLSGLVVSTVNLAFAVGGCFICVSPPVAISVLSVAATSWCSNIIFIVVPQCKGIRSDWLHINGNGESWLY